MADPTRPDSDQNFLTRTHHYITLMQMKKRIVVVTQSYLVELLKFSHFFAQPVETKFNNWSHFIYKMWKVALGFVIIFVPFWWWILENVVNLITFFVIVEIAILEISTRFWDLTERKRNHPNLHSKAIQTDPRLVIWQSLSNFKSVHVNVATNLFLIKETNI